MPESTDQLDDLDPKAYAFKVVNPYWMGSVEQRVRYALAKTGFEIGRMLVSADESQVAFWMMPGERMQFGSVADAHAALHQVLTSAGCPGGEYELTVTFQNDCWTGAYAPRPTEDNLDPTVYVDALPPHV